MNKTQFVILIVFGMLTVVAILIFSGVLPGLRFQTNTAGTVIVWGPIPQSRVSAIFEQINFNQKQITLNYAEKNPQTYESDLLNALATGRGPDIWMLPQDWILKHGNKIYLLTPDVFPERNYRDLFLDEGDLYVAKNGILGFPFIVDPMVLYWNKTFFRNAGISAPPQTWDEFLTDSQKLTIIDPSGKIAQSGTALGVYQNVRHAKEILSALILQTGNPIVDKNTLRGTLTGSGNTSQNPVSSALGFFADFANKQAASYSWSKTMPDSYEAFAAEQLAMYFGFASEYNDIRQKNPHLEFDVSLMPQILDGKNKAAFGKIFALAVSNTSRNIQGSLIALGLLTSPDILAKLSQQTFLPPVRRDLLSQGSQNPIMSVFMKSAVESQAWLDPLPPETTKIFQNMIDSALASRRNIDQTMADANLRLEVLLSNIPKGE